MATFEPLLKYCKISDNGHAPIRMTEGSVGYDLRAAYCAELQPGRRFRVKTDIKIMLPSLTCGLICPRSGHSLSGVDVPLGVIDQDFRGNVVVLMVNNSPVVRQIQRGERIAQLVITPILVPEVVEVKEIPKTPRGEGGFGSTGLL